MGTVCMRSSPSARCSQSRGPRLAPVKARACEGCTLIDCVIPREWGQAAAGAYRHGAGSSARRQERSRIEAGGGPRGRVWTSLTARGLHWRRVVVAPLQRHDSGARFERAHNYDAEMHARVTIAVVPRGSRGRGPGLMIQQRLSIGVHGPKSRASARCCYPVSGVAVPSAGALSRQRGRWDDPSTNRWPSPRASYTRERTHM